MERQGGLPGGQLPLQVSKGVSLGGGMGDGVGTDGVGGNEAEAEGGEVSHGVGLVVYSVIVAG
jgi:hypothetical protein